MGLAYSCGSSRKMEQSNSVATVQSTSSENTSFNYGSTTKLTDFVKKDMTIHFRWVKYDTDKAPDAEGNYPKAGEGSGEVDIHADEMLDIAQCDSTQTETEADFSHEAESEEHTQIESEREDTDIFNDLTWLIIAIVILLLVVCMVRRK